jgi:predicted kinase
MKLYVTRGLPASGKTTWAKTQLASLPELVRANRDTIRLAMFSDANPWRPSKEKEVTQQENLIVETALSMGKSVVIDDTNLSQKTQARWYALATKYNAAVEIIDFTQVPLQECIARDRPRQGKERVGEVVIQNMALRYGLIQWPDKPIVIVDIDGTLANANHRLHYIQGAPRDWASFFREAAKDPVNEIILRWVEVLSKDHCVVIVSGRALDQSQDLTVDWLKEKQVPYDYLFMRAGYDYREDWIVKSEILAKMPRDRVNFSIDDRMQVVTKCWRANGVRCFPVSDGDGEF